MAATRARFALILCALAPAAALSGCGPGQGTSPPAAERSDGDVSSRPPSIDTGLQLLRQGDLKGAEAELAAAPRASPRAPRILEALGSIDARTDRFKQV